MNWKAHIGWVLLIVIAGTGFTFGFRAWLTEHDNRLTAQFKATADEEKIKDLEQQVQDKEKEIADRDAAASKQVQDLQSQVEKVKTPQQVVQEYPYVTDLPLNVRTIPNNGVDVQVAAQPMYQALNECRQQAVQYGACTADLKTKDGIIADKDKIIAQKEDQIKQAAQKPGFWKQLKHDAKTAGISGVVALAIRAIIKGGL